MENVYRMPNNLLHKYNEILLSSPKFIRCFCHVRSCSRLWNFFLWLFTCECSLIYQWHSGKRYISTRMKKFGQDIFSVRLLLELVAQPLFANYPLVQLGGFSSK